MSGISARSENIKAVGIMGGTFDPIHYGHLIIAEESRLRFGLDKVIFIPAGQPAHKTDQPTTDKEHRYAMAVIATAPNPHFSCSRMEMERPGLSYAIDTVRAVMEEYPGAAIHFITGIDAILEILTWHEHAKLKDLCRFVAATRPGYDTGELGRSLPQEYVDGIDVLQVPGVDISGTEIRRRVAAGESIRYLVPAAVGVYISKNSLYTQGGQGCGDL